MTGHEIRFIPPTRHRPGAPAPTLPLLGHETSRRAAAWLEQYLTTCAARVASFVPGHFAAHVRLYHPFEMGGLDPVPSGRWQELADRYGRAIDSPTAAEAFAYNGVPGAQAHVGTLPLSVVDALLEHLRQATATPEQCYFALWTGFSGTVVPPDLRPQLQLPHREYHLFSGPLPAARTTYDAGPFSWQTANLWWPADHAWCIASEIDHAWSYVGGSASLIEAILGDPRLDAAETSAGAVW